MSIPGVSEEMGEGGRVGSTAKRLTVLWWETRQVDPTPDRCPAGGAVLRIFLCVIAMLGSSTALPALTLAQSTPGGDPVHAAELFFDAVGRLDWADMAASVHEETLELYRLYVTSILDADETGQFALDVYGTPDGPALRARSSARLFRDLVAAVHGHSPALLQIMATNSYRFLGHVSEGDTLAHVVARVTPYTTGSAPTKLTTITVKQSNVGWRVHTAPELDAITTAMRGLTFRSIAGAGLLARHRTPSSIPARERPFPLRAWWCE